ncbi:MAG: hydrogenase maturation protein HypF [Pseudonocardiales bacterium]|nr:hydrogenase maturation protein HypF [Pseudonocardiales bacterium]
MVVPVIAESQTIGLGHQRARFTVTGVVQGVGFRPFVQRLAVDLELSGSVSNDALAVLIEVQGRRGQLDEFERRLRAEAPPMSVIAGVQRDRLPGLVAESGFTIVVSSNRQGVRTLVPPDVATCDDCLREMFDPADRRYRHPFITCTNCGPRFTIIRDLPYDRPATTMSQFPMCPRCTAEYLDVGDRRFHAQPIACPDCGPRLRFECGSERIDDPDAAIAAAQRALLAGSIVAIKGVGGYHLACRADTAAALNGLRARKARDEKPFALLVRDIAVAHRLALIDDDEQRTLLSRSRPIVLVRRRAGAPVHHLVAPGNPLLGLLLPYTPIHHLLLSATPGSEVSPLDVLVMTSANITDEPLCFDDQDAARRLPRLTDAVLTHNRPIHVPCDDSVVRMVEGYELPIRRSRGYAPLPVALGRLLPPTLAVGGELKNTCCLIDGANAFCSAHIGDMGSVDTTRAFERAVDQLTTLHRVTPDLVAADEHPGYLTRSWAERHAGGPDEPELRYVQHHHAHVVSLQAEHEWLGRPLLGVAFDGTGYGADATIWGGEFFLMDGDPTRYTRAGHLRAVDLPGGDAAVRNPCRVALAYLAASDVSWDDDLPPVAACTPAERAVVAAALDSGVGTVPCSSMGRLFDAVAALIGIRQRIGFEAQAAIELEIRAERGGYAGGGGWAFSIGADSVLDYAPVIQAIVRDVRAGLPRAVLAYRFHRAVADAVTTVAQRLTAEMAVPAVGLTGGVFQNVLLLRECTTSLRAHGMHVLTHRLVPPNDGGLALGQAVVAALAGNVSHGAVS